MTVLSLSLFTRTSTQTNRSKRHNHTSHDTMIRLRPSYHPVRCASFVVTSYQHISSSSKFSGSHKTAERAYLRNRPHVQHCLRVRIVQREMHKHVLYNMIWFICYSFPLCMHGYYCVSHAKRLASSCSSFPFSTATAYSRIAIAVWPQSLQCRTSKRTRVRPSQAPLSSHPQHSREHLSETLQITQAHAFKPISPHTNSIIVVRILPVNCSVVRRY